MADWQMKYDEERQSKELYRRTSWMLWTIIALAVVVAVAIAAALDVKRPSVRSMRSRIKGRERYLKQLSAFDSHLFQFQMRASPE